MRQTRDERITLNGRSEQTACGGALCHANFPRKTRKLRGQHASDTERRGLVQDAALPVTVVGGEQANARINSCLGECAS